LRYNLPGGHPLIGRSAPDLKFEDGTRLGALLNDGSALLVNLNGNNELQTISKPWVGRVKYVSSQPEDNLGLSAFFVRPDGFVAWATDGEPNAVEVMEVITRWLGKPSA